MNKLGKLICVKKCDNCGENVEIRNKKRLENKNIFCSKHCEKEFRIKQNQKDEKYFNCQCPICKKLFHLKPSRKDKYKTHYCCRACFAEAKKEIMKGEKNHQFGLKGSKNASWKSDRKITVYGYIKVRSSDHPFRDCDDFVFEHRLVAEKYLLNLENSIEINGKKYLKKEYVVHHIDGNRKNNNVENLRIMTLEEHTSLHQSKKIGVLKSEELLENL